MSEQPKDGGPAFPQSDVLREDGAELCRTAYGGMSLRDWFAGQALAGITANPATRGSGDELIGALSVSCYDIADTMLAAREVPHDR
jgi:hypothetical protein